MEKRLFSRWLAIMTILLMSTVNAAAMSLAAALLHEPAAEENDIDLSKLTTDLTNVDIVVTNDPENPWIQDEDGSIHSPGGDRSSLIFTFTLNKHGKLHINVEGRRELLIDGDWRSSSGNDSFVLLPGEHTVIVRNYGEIATITGFDVHECVEEDKTIDLSKLTTDLTNVDIVLSNDPDYPWLQNEEGTLYLLEEYGDSRSCMTLSFTLERPGTFYFNHLNNVGNVYIDGVSVSVNYDGLKYSFSSGNHNITIQSRYRYETITGFDVHQYTEEELAIDPSKLTTDLNNVDFTITNDPNNPWVQEPDGSIHPLIDGESSILISFNLTRKGFIQFYGPNIGVIIDDKEFREQGYSYYISYDSNLEEGHHIVKFSTNRNGVGLGLSYFNVYECRDWYETTATKTGLSILKEGVNLQDVHCLKVRGKMNTVSMKQLSSLPLHAVDMSGATADSIPSRGLNFNSEVHYLSLPEGIMKIGYMALDNVCLNLLVIPETVEEIQLLGNYDTDIEKLILPNSLKRIKKYGLSGIHLKELYTSDGKYSLPPSLTEIDGEEGVVGGWLNTLVLPPTICTYYDRTFYEDYYDGGFDTVRFTGVDVPFGYQMFGDGKGGEPIPADLPLIVPPIAYDAFMRDPYFKNGNIVKGEEITYWAIDREWTFNDDMTTTVKPDVDLISMIEDFTGHFNVEGSKPLALGRVNLPIRLGSIEGKGVPTIISNNNSLAADTLSAVCECPEKETWYFFTPLVDVNIEDIRVEYAGKGERPTNMDYTIRYYDGDYRAANGIDANSGSWKNVTEPMLKAGRGYIFRATHESNLILPGKAASGVVALRGNEVTLTLESHPSNYVYDSNWNFLGNPFASYFDIRHIDYNGPITVLNNETKRYEAYNAIDDEFALAPGQPFFVQKPDTVSSITFRPDGRLHTDEFVGENRIRPMEAGYGSDRLVVDLVLENASEDNGAGGCGSGQDRTRIVLNEGASVDYELTRDASKFMSLRKGLPQIYTLDNRNARLAINERPVADGECRLGVYLPSTDDEYAISSLRTDTGVYLYDKETSAETYLGGGDRYLFTASKTGYVNDRFVIRITPTSLDTPVESCTKILTGEGYITIVAEEGARVTVTGIDGVVYYNGGPATVRLQSGIYVVTADGKNHKVLVK